MVVVEGREGMYRPTYVWTHHFRVVAVQTTTGDEERAAVGVVAFFASRTHDR
jgi:hypothetical protein